MLEINKIHLGDCLKLMKEIPDNSVDLVLTDPPYNISQKNRTIDRSNCVVDSMRRKSPLIYDFGAWDNMEREEFLEFTEQWIIECARVLRDGGTFISFFNKEDISYLGWVGNAHDIRTRTVFTWHKTNPMPSVVKSNYLSACEFAWIGSKGKETWTFNFGSQKDMHNFFETTNKSIYGETNHPTEKPITLISHLLNIHSNENDLILDCFSGSGTTAVCCVRNKRNFIAIEQDEDFYKESVERLKKEKFKRKLF